MKPTDFISVYAAALKTQDWTNVAPLIHGKAVITFSNGAVHEGKDAIQIAIERNFALIKNDTYQMENIRWVIIQENMAVYIFDFSWSGIILEESVNAQGVGISVLVWEEGKWMLIAEHLSRK